uniref:Enolase-phosphatase E1-like n=1 Tax=Saccoglossus kowalevskii TaxID=10224 RepID=A0ABM0MR34_SACKO|nr:PREDICTED: enolase-phosphatase E1-like [Saccoglossus kowalevskii]
MKFHSTKIDLSLKILREELVGLRASGDTLSRQVATMFRTFNEMKDSGALSDVSDVEFEYESDDDSQTTNPSSAGSLDDDFDYISEDRSRELRRASCPTNSLDSGYYSRSDSSYGRPMRPGSLYISPPISGEEDNYDSSIDIRSSSEDEYEPSHHHGRCACCPPSPTESVESVKSFCSSRSSSSSSLSESDDETDDTKRDNFFNFAETHSSGVAEKDNSESHGDVRAKNDSKQFESEEDAALWRRRRLSPVYENSPGHHEPKGGPFIPTLVFERKGEEEKRIKNDKVPLSPIVETSIDDVPPSPMSPILERKSSESADDSHDVSDTTEDESVKTEVEVDDISTDEIAPDEEPEIQRSKSVRELKAAFQAKSLTDTQQKSEPKEEKVKIKQKTENHVNLKGKIVISEKGVENRLEESHEPDRKQLATQVRELKRWWKDKQNTDEKSSNEKNTSKSLPRKINKVAPYSLIDNEGLNNPPRESEKKIDMKHSEEVRDKKEDYVPVEAVYSKIHHDRPTSVPRTAIVVPSAQSDDELLTPSRGRGRSRKKYINDTELQKEHLSPSERFLRSLSMDEGFQLMHPVRGMKKPSRTTITSKIKQRRTPAPQIANIISPDIDIPRDTGVLMQPVRSQVYRREHSCPPEMRIHDNRPKFLPFPRRYGIGRRWSLTPEELKQKEEVSPKRRHCVGSDPYAETHSAKEYPPARVCEPLAQTEQLSASKVVLSAKTNNVQNLFKELQQTEKSTDDAPSPKSAVPKGAKYGDFMFVKENRLKQMPDGSTKSSKCLKIVVKSVKKLPTSNDESKVESRDENANMPQGRDKGETSKTERVTTTFKTQIGNVDHSDKTKQIQLHARTTPLITREIPLTTVTTGYTPYITTDIPIVTRSIPILTTDNPVVTRHISTNSREIPITITQSPRVMQEINEDNAATFKTEIDTEEGGNVIVIRRVKHFQPKKSTSSVMTNLRIDVPSNTEIGNREFKIPLQIQQSSYGGQMNTQRLQSGRVKSTYRHTFGTS